jgi:uncharacterized protein (TIGR00251 family)
MKIQVKVKPNSLEQSIEKDGEIYIVNLKSRAEDGRANKELLKFISKYFHSEAKIKSGFSSRSKIIEIFE